MKCLRCGYCCKVSMVVIIDNPEGPFNESNVITCNLLEDGPCKHLCGNKPGEYACKIHDKSWYKKTPCFSHGQIESSITDNCRLGEYFLKGGDAHG